MQPAHPQKGTLYKWLLLNSCRDIKNATQATPPPKILMAVECALPLQPSPRVLALCDPARCSAGHSSAHTSPQAHGSACDSLMRLHVVSGLLTSSVCSRASVRVEVWLTETLTGGLRACECGRLHLSGLPEINPCPPRAFYTVFVQAMNQLSHASNVLQQVPLCFLLQVALELGSVRQRFELLLMAVISTIWP